MGQPCELYLLELHPEPLSLRHDLEVRVELPRGRAVEPPRALEPPLRRPLLGMQRQQRLRRELRPPGCGSSRDDLRAEALRRGDACARDSDAPDCYLGPGNIFDGDLQ